MGQFLKLSTFFNIMKVACVILCALVAYAAAGSLENIIAAEVKNIIANNPGISAAHCTTKCDALFDMDAAHDEQLTDRECQFICNRQLNGGHIFPPRTTHA